MPHMDNILCIKHSSHSPGSKILLFTEQCSRKGSCLTPTDIASTFHWVRGLQWVKWVRCAQHQRRNSRYHISPSTLTQSQQHHSNHPHDLSIIPKSFNCSAHPYVCLSCIFSPHTHSHLPSWTLHITGGDSAASTLHCTLLSGAQRERVKIVSVTSRIPHSLLTHLTRGSDPVMWHEHKLDQLLYCNCYHCHAFFDVDSTPDTWSSHVLLLWRFNDDNRLICRIYDHVDRFLE